MYECIKQGIEICDIVSVIGLGQRDARFHTLDKKNEHICPAKCAIFASIIFFMVNK